MSAVQQELFKPTKQAGRHIAARMIAALKRDGGWMTRAQFHTQLNLSPRECRAGRKASHGRIVMGQKGFKWRDYATLEEVRDCIKFFEAIQRDAAQEIKIYSEKSHRSLHVREAR